MITNMSTTTNILASPNKDANLGFRFRQFFVSHDRSSMKVGTDGVLLGAWAPVSNQPLRILDIGTGSGLIALMLAQRCPEAQIDAIDIDPASCHQAQANFAASPWPERLNVMHCSLQEWANGQRLMPNNQDYDLIASNPPYFTDSLKAPDAARCAARHNDSLPFDMLILHAAQLLKPDGILALIVPLEAEPTLQSLATPHGLQCICRCYVHPKPQRPPKRVLIAWTNGKLLGTESTERTEKIILEDEHGTRSAEYRQLTKDFYL